MIINQYDSVILKDGRRGDVMEAYDGKVFDIDVGSSPKDWETVWGVTLDDIAEVVKLENQKAV